MPAIASLYIETGLDRISTEDIRKNGWEGLCQNSSSAWSMLECAGFAEDVGYDPDTFAARAKELSRGVQGEAIALLSHSGAFYVEFFLFRRGKLVRHLCQSDDGWRVDGRRQKWESKLFRGVEDFDEDVADDDPTRRAVETQKLTEGAREPIVRIEQLLDAMSVPEEFEAPTTSGSGLPASPRQLMIAWLVVGIAAIGVEVSILEPSSTSSILIFGITLVAWILGLKWLQKRNGGRPILG